MSASTGLIRRMQVTDAAAHDGARLREGLIDPANTASDVWADTAYRSAANEAWLARHGRLGPHSSQEAVRQAVPGTYRPRQPHEITHPGESGACLRRAEGTHGSVRPNYRDQADGRHDHHDQRGPQHEALALARQAQSARMREIGGTNADQIRATGPMGQRKLENRPNIAFHQPFPCRSWRFQWFPSAPLKRL